MIALKGFSASPPPLGRVKKSLNLDRGCLKFDNCLRLLSSFPSPLRDCVILRKEPTFRNGGEAVGWKRFRAVTFNLFEFKCSNPMNTFDLLPGTISHHLKDPHSKSLEPDCLSPINLPLRHSLREERKEGGLERAKLAGSNLKAQSLTSRRDRFSFHPEPISDLPDRSTRDSTAPSHFLKSLFDLWRNR